MKASNTGATPRELLEATFERTFKQYFALQERYKGVMRKIGPVDKKGFFSDKQITLYEKLHKKLSIGMFCYLRRQPTALKAKPVERLLVSDSCTLSLTH